MYSNNSTAPNAVGRVGGGRARVGLADKRHARHQATLSSFRNSMIELNRAIDEEQMARLAALKNDLASSHAESEAILAEERARVEGHEHYLAHYIQRFAADEDEQKGQNEQKEQDAEEKDGMGRIKEGDVLPPFDDFFHRAPIVAAETGVDLSKVASTAAADAQAAMKTERLRLLSRAVLLRRLYSARVAAVADHQRRLDEAEVRRREATQVYLRQLMLALAKVSYCSVTASHALAQRVLHGANDQIALNAATTQVLLSQLGQREVLKQRSYAQAMASLLSRSRTCMERSSACWARTLLQSAVFRRPANRITAVERVLSVSARARKDGVNFLASLSAVVATLRSTSDKGIVPASPPPPAQDEDAHRDGHGDAEGSTLAVPPRIECGGVGDAGWLRLYSPDPYTDPFPNGCDEVVDEWRMKAAVVLGNVRASCQEVVREAKRWEVGRQQGVEAVRSALQEALEWLQVPLEEELPLLAAASLLLPDDAAATAEDGAGVMDGVFQPFSEPKENAAPTAAAESDRVLRLVSRSIAREGEWFVAVVERGLLESFTAFERLLTSATSSVLRWFEQSTSELVQTTRGVMNPVRAFYVRRCEKQKDTADELAQREAAYADLCARLAKVASPAAAEALFADGLRQLDAIAAVYTARQQHTVADLRAALSTVSEATTACYSQFMSKLGLESIEDTESRLEAARQERIEAALAEVRQEQQQQQQQQQMSASAANASGQSGKRRGTNKKETPSAAASTANASALDSEAAASLYDEQQALALSQLRAEIPHETVAYSQIRSASGSVFNVVGPMTLVAEEELAPTSADGAGGGAAAIPHPPPPRGGSGGTDSSTRSAKRPLPSQQPKHQGAEAASPGKKPTAQTTDAATDVPVECVSTYAPMLQDTILTPRENFLPPSEVETWKAALREELLNWLLTLRSSADTAMRVYCAKARAEVEQETNELLRRHRRRPAALQADVYEARVRGLEDEGSSTEKHMRRCRERLAKLSTQWAGFLHDPQLLARESGMRAETERIEAQAATAASLSALQSLERRHAAQCASYADGFAQSCNAALSTIATARHALEEECRRSLADRAHTLAQEELGEGVTLEHAIANDEPSSLLREVLAELERADAAIRDEAEAAVRERQATAEAARERCAAVVADNEAELRLIAKVQEAFSWLKTQQHTFQMSSTAAESALAEAVDAWERALARAIAQPALVEAVHQQLQEEDAGNATVGDGPTAPLPAKAGSGLSREAVESLLTALDGELQLTRTSLQRETRSSPLAAALEALSGLREMLYVRGVTLGALAYSVELVPIATEYAIEPAVVVKDGDAVGAAGSSAGRASGGAGAAPAAAAASGRRSRTTSSSSASLAGAVSGRTALQQVQLLPLPQATSASAQFASWVAQTTETVERLVAEHAAQHPHPLRRSLPGSELATTTSVGASADPTTAAHAAVEAFCRSQEERLAAHVEQSKKVYYQQVHRVSDAALAVPRFAAAALHALAASAVEQRLGHVLRAYGGLARRSEAAREASRRALKVSLGAKASREALSTLAGAETARQQLAKEGITLFWGLALREVQDENDRHAARCYTAVNTFFNILRGLVVPERLVPFEWDDAVGPHRGLRQLMRLRAQQGAEAVAEELEGEGVSGGRSGGGGGGGGKRERRQQEPLPLPKQDGARRSSGPGTGSTNSSGGGGGGSNHLPRPRSPSSLPTAAQLQPSVAYNGLPLLRVKPLDAFNSVHQDAAVAPLNTVYHFFRGLAEAEAAASGGGSAAPAPPQQSSRRSTTNAKHHSIDAAPSYVADGAQLATPAIHGAPTRLHRDTMGAARDAVDILSKEVVAVVEDLNDTFRAWEGREDKWQRSWQVMVGQLHDSQNASSSTSPAR